MKDYQYKAVVLEDRGHLTHPAFIDALNNEGRAQGTVPCPCCGGASCGAKANGWKHKEEQPMGSSKLAVLLEREVEYSCLFPGSRIPS